MALKDVLKVSRKTFFDPRGWLGFDTLKTSSLGLWAILKGLFSIAEPTRRETFAEAMQRLQLTEDDLQKTSQRYFSLTAIFIFLGVVTLLTSFYFLFHHETVAGWILAIATASIFFSQAFRYHFWFFQIKHRKLGCTLKEWWRGKPDNREETKL